MKKDSERAEAARPQAPTHTKVRLPARLGALRCGPYVAGQVYEIPHDEAERLVRVKGFDVVGSDAGDAHQINREE